MLDSKRPSGIKPWWRPINQPSGTLPPAPGPDKMTRQKRLDLLHWARTLKIFVSYLWRCEEYGGLAQIAHGIELGPANKSFTIDCGFVGQSLGVACAEWVQYFIHHQRCIETSQPRADKNYCTFSRTSIFLPEFGPQFLNLRFFLSKIYVFFLT